jgi:hypothetical protein
MKNTLFVTVLMLGNLSGFSQVTDAEKQLRSQKEDTVLGWNKGGIININLSQASLTNWAAGGQSSFAMNGLLSIYAHNVSVKGIWENYLDAGYGTLTQGKSSEWRKTDDKIDFTSKYGYKTAENLYIAVLINFKTQMANGYNYPNDSVRISGFIAPGYMLASIGLDYRPSENFTAYLAPLTYKLTLVNDNDLSDAGAFGVNAGKKSKHEFGGYLRLFLKKDLMQNISFQSKLDLFSNYLNKPQNIDVSWECLVSLKVNKFFSATLSTNLLYDDDIDLFIDSNNDGIIDETGPRVQFKEVLAIGLSMNF